MQFTKMHGLGNDYLYHYGEISNVEELSRKLSDRHFGIGSDGIITISDSNTADFKMRIFNADGSEAKMCGNGIRCVGKYVYDKGYTDRDYITVETMSGIKSLSLQVKEGRVEGASVSMGTAKMGEEKTLIIDEQTITGRCVSMGNPHFVILCEDAEKIPLSVLGPKIEKHEEFPGGVNVEFVSPVGENEVRMRVWERGSGITMACGTGACASAAAFVSKDLCLRNEPVTVHLDGGDLFITVSDENDVLMKGPSATVCECEVDCD